jgi:hypothetical protein
MSKKKITDLTPAQWKRMEAFRAECLAIGKSTEPSDWGRQAVAIAAMYQEIGEKAPIFLPAGSPMGAHLLWQELSRKKDTKPNDQKIPYQHALYGGMELCWAGFWLFGDEIAKYTEKEKRLIYLWQEQAHGGPWFPYKGICILTQRPDRLTFDDDNRLHNETQSAVHYVDGWELYYWHGVAVTKQIITAPETLTIEQIHGEQNAEVRRIMIERLGTRTFIERCNPDILDVDDDQHNGSRALMKVRIKDAVFQYLVCACPSTGRVYHMEVPPEVTTCKSADDYLQGPLASVGRQVGRT